MKKSKDTLEIQQRARIMERNELWAKLTLANPAAAKNRFNRLARKHGKKGIK